MLRNDFLDRMIEMRQAGKEEMEGNMQSANNSNPGATFSKLQQIHLSGVIGYYLKLTETCKICTISHLLALNHPKQTLSLNTLLKQILVFGRLNTEHQYSAMGLEMILQFVLVAKGKRIFR